MINRIEGRIFLPWIELLSRCVPGLHSCNSPRGAAGRLRENFLVSHDVSDECNTMVLLHDIPHFLRLPSQQQLKLQIRRRLGW